MEAGGFPTRLCIALAISLISLDCIYTDNGPGFVSIDCGGNTTYSDANDILWTPDSGSSGIDGVVSSVSPPAYVKSNQTPLSSFRFFPGSHSKYCYVFEEGILEGGSYLIRASFWAGEQLPYRTKVDNSVSFKLLIYTDEWDTVSITFPQTSREVNKEIYVLAIRQNIEVCLSGKSTDSDLDVPFISSLVLRPLSTSLHPIKFSVDEQNRRPLMTVSRKNYGARDASDYVRYSGAQVDGYSDIYDRIWEADTDGTLLFTNESIFSNSTSDEVPIPVMQTARSDPESISLQFQVTPHSWYFCCEYYAEISPKTIGKGVRVFDSVVSNKTSKMSGTYDVFGAQGQYSTLLECQRIYVDTPAYLDLQMQKKVASIQGPLINAIEVFRTFDKDLSLGTIDAEVSAVKNITDNFGSLSSCKGDPCLPYPYNWLSCSSDERPSITQINLENQDLSGDIASYFNSLKNLTVLSLASNKLFGSIPDLSSLLHLTSIDLHNNSLSGEIPSFLGTLPSLKTLDLSNNNLSGVVPAELLTRASKSGLVLRLAGNKDVCAAKNAKMFCSKQNNYALVVGTSIAVVAVIVLVIIFVVKRYRRVTPVQHNISDEQPREFSSKEIQSLTNNKKTELARGIFLGTFANGVKVAVKVLPENSQQSDEEFLDEVRSVHKVRNKRLVKLLGYCNGKEDRVLVYEHMALGSLHKWLHVNCRQHYQGEGGCLTWEERLRIAAQAAEGLEYLHEKCNPPIIHGDVTSSNILLLSKSNAKVFDFWIIKSTKSQQEPRTATDAMTFNRGTRGYNEDVDLQSEVPDASMDVHAFGMLLLEIVTGKNPIKKNASRGKTDGDMVKQVEECRRKGGNVADLLDSTMQPFPITESVDITQSVSTVLGVALECVRKDKGERPKMRWVRGELRVLLESLNHIGPTADIEPPDDTVTYDEEKLIR